jgi:carbonic anhydrase
VDIKQDLIEGNRAFADGFDESEATMPAPPAKKLAVVACMDSRHSICKVLGLHHGDAKIIRNAGNHVSDDAIRSLVVGAHYLGVENVAVMGHTKCGMTSPDAGGAIMKSLREQGVDEANLEGVGEWLGGFPDVVEQVRAGMAKVRNHPLLPRNLNVVGFVYDNDTGRIVPVD